MSSFEQHLAERIDWTHPDLADVQATERNADPRRRLLAVVHRIRRHDDEYFGFSSGFQEELRASSSAEQIARARALVDAALAGDLFFPPHSNAFSALGETVLLLGLDDARAEQLAQRVLDRQADWPRNVWMFGITHGVANLLRCLSPQRAIRDEHLLPILGWLCSIVPVEWNGARGWSERLLGCSGHNWYVHSYYGFWMAGAMFPHFQGLKPFAALAPSYLEREAHVLFNEDGWSKEGSAGYHRFAAMNVFAFARLAERHGVTFRPEFRAKLRTIADATWRMQAPDRQPPIFGDATWEKSSGRDLALLRLAARFQLAQARGALEQLDPGVPAPEFLADNGDNLAPAWSCLRAEPPPLDTALPHTGLYAMRSDWTPSGDWLAINAMTIGPVVTSHQHADIFNFELCVRGRRVLQDNWYGDVTEDDGSYQSAPEVRNDPMKRRWRVGSTAHNVATVNNEDQVPVEQIYRYGRTERPFVDSFVSAERYGYFSGVHEAYRRAPTWVSAHRRSLFYLRSRYWILIDRFTVEKEEGRKFQQHFHLAKGAETLPNGQVRTHGEGGNLLVVPVRGLTGTLTLESNPHPIRSYANPDHAMIECSSNSNVVMAVLLVPFLNDDMPRVNVESAIVSGHDRDWSAWEATALRIQIGDQADFFFKQHMHWNLGWCCDNHTGTGRLFHSQIGEIAE